jgi:hypothetical protein
MGLIGLFAAIPPIADGYTPRSDADHQYPILYEHYLGYLRLQAIRLLEIGLINGGSLATWSRILSKCCRVGP